MLNTDKSSPEQVILENNARIRDLPAKVRQELAALGEISKDKVPNSKKLPAALDRATSIKTRHLDLLFLKK